MYIRCVDCRRSTWIEPVGIDSSVELVCSGCARTYTIVGSRELGRDAQDQFRKALELAEHKSLDLPSAWSVLAGTMTLRQAHAVRADMGLETPAGTPPEQRLASEPAKTAQPEGTEDAAPREAGAGRSRKEQAKRLAQKHGLPLSLARRVAKKEITLAAARLLKPELGQPQSEPSAEPPGKPAFTWPSGWKLPSPKTAAIVAGLALLPALWLLWPHGTREAEVPRPVTPADTEIQRDTAGHPVQIVGSEPEDVLIAYCNETSGRCEPLKLTLSSPPRAGLRLGIFRKPGQHDSYGAIEIRRQGRARRWVAGDGQARIPAVDNPQVPPGSAELSTQSL